MDYELTNEQQVHTVIRCLPNDWGYIKMILSRTKYILIFENIRQRLVLEEELRVATEVIGAKVHMSTSNSRNDFKRKDPGNWIDKDQSNNKLEHDQQGKEECTKKKDLTQAKWLNCDQMGHHAHDYKVLNNILLYCWLYSSF